MRQRDARLTRRTRPLYGVRGASAGYTANSFSLIPRALNAAVLDRPGNAPDAARRGNREVSPCDTRHAQRP